MNAYGHDIFAPKLFLPGAAQVLGWTRDALYRAFQRAPLIGEEFNRWGKFSFYQLAILALMRSMGEIGITFEESFAEANVLMNGLVEPLRKKARGGAIDSDSLLKAVENSAFAVFRVDGEPTYVRCEIEGATKSVTLASERRLPPATTFSAIHVHPVLARAFAEAERFLAEHAVISRPSRDLTEAFQSSKKDAA